MRHSKIIAPILVGFLAASFVNAFAQEATGTKTREQVQAELAEAKRTGDVMCDNESRMKEREANPSKYPAQAKVPGKTRAQVKTELEEAKRLGNVPADSDTGVTMREKNPQRYPAK